MKAFLPYLNFNGNAREAMTFYHQALGGELEIQTFKDVGADGGNPAMSDRVMHARLNHGNAYLMASDSMPEHPYVEGTNCHVTLEADSAEEIDKAFKGILAGGKVAMELQDTFWGARFGMGTDKFGINWMFNFTFPK